MTQGDVPAVRRPPARVAGAEIAVAAPPELAPSSSPGLLVRLLPLVMSVATLGITAVVFFSGSDATRNPTFLVFPLMMVVSMVLTVMSGRGQRRGRGIYDDRVDYLGYLNRLRKTVMETVAAQRSSLEWSHCEPDTLWTLVGGPRTWERRAAGADFGRARVGRGAQPLARRLVPPEIVAAERCDPVTVVAMRRFIRTHAAIDAVPITICLPEIGLVVIDGEADVVRGLLRAMICQLAVLHPPDQLLIAGVIGDRRQADWDWLKWLPHNQHPTATDSVGPVRMVYGNPVQMHRALDGAGLPYLVVISDVDEEVEFDSGVAISRMTVLRAGVGGSPVTLRYGGETQPLGCPDHLDTLDALICARRLAAHRVNAASPYPHSDAGWASLIGVEDIARFDPIKLWDSLDHDSRLRVPIGTSDVGAPVELDIKEPAEGGMGPHGLCVGATGSGKSELLRTVALGMIASNSPEVLNLLLIDFKGGATFLDLAPAPHVAAVITNLAEEAPLVARMRDALAGELNRRQQLLRTAGCVSVARYQHARRAGKQLAALPTLFIIVDEFSELLSQHPDFADMFVAIGRLGRSLGMHLLLASQRLDEGRLRGLESHLSYRLCLKTLSASESRTVLGTADAFELPGTPGVGFLRSGSGELVRFRAAFASEPLRTHAPTGAAALGGAPLPCVQPFTAGVVGPVTGPIDVAGVPDRSVLRAVVERLAGQGPAAYPVWLPPLSAAPPLDRLLSDTETARSGLTVPLGVVDRPFEQCRTPLIVDLSSAAGNLAVVGAPQAGKSTALRTLITALAATHDPGRVQFYCLDFGGGTLASIGTLPHVGAVAGRAEPRLVGRIVTELESIVRTREARYRDHGVHSIAQYRQLRIDRTDVADEDPFGDVFLVIDGWGSLRHEFGELEESIISLAAQGLSFGVHVVLSASRWADIRPALRDQIGTRIELRLGDPTDSEVDRKRAHEVPHNRPGRGLSRDGLHMVLSLPLAGDEPWRDHGALVAPPIPLLSTHVDHEAVVRQAGTDLSAQILLGLEERRLQPLAVDFERESHLLILGDNECGKTATLRTLCREIMRTKTAAQAQLLVVDFRRSLLGVVESKHLGGYAMSPAGLAVVLPDLRELLNRRMPPVDASQTQLRSRSWWSGPDVFVVVDDYDLVVAPAGNPLGVLLEYLPYARDLGLHLIIARRSGGAARALFEPLLAGLRDFGCLGLMMSGRPDEGVLMGSGRPARLPPGRGVFLTRTGEEQLVQVGWCPDS
ncbi:secretion protein EccC [Mycobacterium numidiamassiliense]|uniref:Secretion protein EccC n=1 Tax=Mycobacterium numidiamassiliense TaxID=1841861 RepID=A0A2U3P4I0_9MYCO|nr:type VII secretion protein EccCa [Mycobacterium numidiamassiliense]SPM38565.1 secretion protein EccC [Mycobacterium numidiamassiliense]